MKRFWPWVAALALLVAAGCSPGASRREQPDPTVLRLGYLANLTHAQAVLGVADGSFAAAAGVKIVPKVFASGPTAMTALLAGEIDVLYVGPSPAVTGYIRSEGKALRIVAGAASGGAVLVVRPGIDPDHLAGRRVATPGIANTQDVSLRYLLHEQGLRPREEGGTVDVTPVAPAEMLGLFARGQLDAAWVAEPWGARLVAETGAQIALDERDLWPDRRFATTVVVASTAYLQANPAAVRGLLKAHAAKTAWIGAHPAEARTALQRDLAALQGKPLPDQVLADAMSRLEFLTDPLPQAVTTQAQRAYELGYLGARRPDLTGLFDLRLLQEVAP